MRGKGSRETFITFPIILSVAMASKTPEQARRDWEQNSTSEAWERGLDNPRRSVAEGLADFWGGSAGQYSGLQNKYEDNVQQAISDNRYERGVEGKGSVWEERAREGARNVE